MLVDSHCHLDFPPLVSDLEGVLGRMAQNGVTQALCVGVSLAGFADVSRIANAHSNLWASVGVHPDQPPDDSASVDDLVARAQEPKVLAIGETGLDYYRQTSDQPWQRDRFRMHVRAARRVRKPLIIHCRAAAEDLLTIMRDEGADEVGGVMHCFTESWDVAQAAMELGFLISFSGIVTFRNAAELREVAARVPLDRILVETDAPYLAPVPHRGRTNEPGWVTHVAQEIARIKGVTFDVVAAATTANFDRVFHEQG